MKPILSMDFDGVISGYQSGWQGADVISDPPVPGAIEFLRAAQEYFTVAIFSTRSHQAGGLEAMQEWLKTSARVVYGGGDLNWLNDIAWPTVKPPALVGIDDRVLTFDGTWPDPAKLIDFKPWNKRDDDSKAFNVEQWSIDTATRFMDTFPHLQIKDSEPVYWLAQELRAALAGEPSPDGAGLRGSST